MAGVSERTVQLVYDTWQLAAEEDHCTPADQLLPDDDDPKLSDVDVGDHEHREMWRKFYRQTRERRTGNTKGRSGSGRRQNGTSSSHSQHDDHSESTANESPSAESESTLADDSAGENGSVPTAHPLYGLLLAMNILSDALKRGASAASVVAAAEKVATKEHRAALRRTIGVL